MTAGAVLTGRHLRWPAKADSALAEVETDPRYPGALLRNLTDETWTVQPEGEDTKTVKPGYRLLARADDDRASPAAGGHSACARDGCPARDEREW